MHNLFKIKNKSIIFIHIPKTAGTSIVHSLGGNNINHLLLSDYPNHILSNSFVFSCVRNPFDRFVSQWLYHTNFEDNFFYKKYKKKFDIFYYYDLVKTIKHKYISWNTMTNFLKNKNKSVDFILHFEKLNNDWKNLCKLLDFNFELSIIKNNINRNHYSYYYNNYLISKIEEMYEEDLINFNYKFERKL